MMDFVKFKREIIKEMENRAGIGKVEIRDILKNNEVHLTGLVISRPVVNVSPVIYLEEYYKEMQNKGLSEIADDIWAFYLENALNEKTGVLQLTDWESAKSRIVVKLINYELNKELLEEVPHERFLDLAVVYQYVLAIEEDGAAAFLINDRHLEMWGAGKTDLQKYAYKNYKNFCPAAILNMRDVIAEVFGEVPEDWKKDESSPELPIYIATNQMKWNGASIMLFPDELKPIAEKSETDLYILPSSVHEILLLPVKGNDVTGLKKIVYEVNETAVQKTERLSDSVYYYSRENGKISIALE